MTDQERDFIGYGANPPVIEWPGKARIAVSVVVNYEEGSETSLLDGDAAHETNNEVPSPVPASNTRNAGGAGSSAASSAPMRWPIAHFSLQVVTNSRYFSRLSKKRNGRSPVIWVSGASGSDV